MREIYRVLSDVDVKLSDIAFWLRSMKVKGQPCRHQKELEQDVTEARARLEDLKRGLALFSEAYTIASDIQREVLQARINKLDPDPVN